jgi:hypothetical protein
MRTYGPLLSLLALTACPAPERPILSDVLVGSCDYISPFTNDPECRDYLGTWSDEDAAANCTKLKSTFVPDQACTDPDVLGWCLTDDDGEQLRIAILGTDAGKCGISKTGCQFFGGGYWEPAEICQGQEEIVVTDNVFPRPEKLCVDPIPGEPPGQSEGGKVCTWNIISGATEEGRYFSDYGSCDTVRLQRPYSPVPPNARYAEPDSRMDDPAYVADVDWLRGQMKSGACICCHDAMAPNGPSVFDADAEGNVLNQFNDRGIAMGAGWISTVGFGSYPAEDNNGFGRADLERPHDSIFPTTDMPRMIAIFEREAAHRGLSEADFANDTYGAGPLDALRNYTPGPCTDDEGIDKRGRITWAPGRVRYLSILEAGSTSPTVPPNLEVPEGTLWRVQLDADADPIASGEITYGEVPATMKQVFPATGTPAKLEKGKTYYLHASADIAYPISRCEFVAK